MLIYESFRFCDALGCLPHLLQIHCRIPALTGNLVDREPCLLLSKHPITYICSQGTTNHHAQKLIYRCVLIAAVWPTQTKISKCNHQPKCNGNPALTEFTPTPKLVICAKFLIFYRTISLGLPPHSSVINCTTRNYS